ncbi:MAG: DUF4838 domain-containing protein, partial [Kiritimatiellia bacterium]
MKIGLATLVGSLACLMAAAGCCSFVAGKDNGGRSSMRLAVSNQTDYAVVRPDNPTEVDDYAVTTLTNFLFQKTGAMFPVIKPGQATPAGKYIFVGLSGPALKLAGKDPLASLKDQEYVARSCGADILLYGKGMHGNLYAVMDFMENILGWRWYSPPLVHGDAQQRASERGVPVFTVEPNLAIKPFSRQGGFSFACRMPIQGYLFDYNIQNGMTQFHDLDAHAKVFSLKVMPMGGHTLFGYIPPSPQAQPWTNLFGWLPRKDYFTNNPDFFGMSPQGKRDLQHQLCFSNPDLRQELTKNVLEHIRLLKAEGLERLLINVSAMDTPPEFCCCPGCRKLKEKYSVPGGPFYDYMFELCALVKEKHPDTMLHTIAYRLSQTQKPPVMPEGQAFPDNLVIQFADVQDNTDADWNSPQNRPSYEDLLSWGKLTPHVWVWYYPNTYADGGRMPNGNINRLVTDIRLMKKAGVEGVMLEHDTFDVYTGHNFTQLQRFIFTKLLKDVESDVPALIREFTDYQYGPAASLARKYLEELEEAQKKASHDTSFSAGRSLERVMTGITPRMLRDWQNGFDRMEADTANDARCRDNVHRLRHTLDFATLKHWNDLAKAYPDYFADYRAVTNRLGKVLHWDKPALEDWEALIKAGGVEKPLPAPFDGMDKALIRRYVPERKGGLPKIVMDPDAAFGYASVVDAPNKPFTFGFYQNDAQKPGPVCTLNPDDIQRGGYRLYKLG